jgi:hypothetical protein
VLYHTRYLSSKIALDNLNSYKIKGIKGINKVYNVEFKCKSKGQVNKW